ncbi:MAG TPA: sugar phosphate isomerase/epimerase family protein [Acidimicrobiia bacterium]|nr:sugar phosphate isomerase/epimerase family protein [Acidimicrobiia bacterium]
MFTYGAEILPYHDFTLDESLAELAGLGFTHVNLWTSAPPLASHVNPGDDIEEIKATLGKYGMTATGLTMYGKDQDEIAQRIELAGALGIDTVIFDSEANFSEFVSSFLPPLADLADRHGVRIAVENHLTVPFTENFESGGNEELRWDEGVDTFAQIKRLVTELDRPNVGVCLAPPHLWVVGDSIVEAATFLLERKKLFYYYIWDIDPAYRHGVDGLNFGPGEKQLPRPDGVLDHRVPLRALSHLGYEGVASLKCHGTHGWSKEKVTSQLHASDTYVRSCLPR